MKYQWTIEPVYIKPGVKIVASIVSHIGTKIQTKLNPNQVVPLTYNPHSKVLDYTPATPYLSTNYIGSEKRLRGWLS